MLDQLSSKMKKSNSSQLGFNVDLKISSVQLDAFRPNVSANVFQVIFLHNFIVPQQSVISRMGKASRISFSERQAVSNLLLQSVLRS